MNKIKSIEQAENIISKKLGISVEELLSTVFIVLGNTNLSFESWKSLAEWCESKTSNISFNLLSAYLKTFDLRA